MNVFLAMARHRAIQDQEIAAAADWVRRHLLDGDADDLMAFANLWTALNNPDVCSLREFSDDELTIVATLAMIGLGEALHSLTDQEIAAGGE